PTPGIGFAMGVDRLALMLEAQFKHRAGADVYLVSQGDEARLSALVLAEQIRSELNGLRVVVHCGDGKFKAQLKKADASQAQVALIIGEAEAEQDQVGFKLLREGSEQLTLPGSKIVAELKKVFA
ncbi:MAG: histidine--tRNA ligase, partial [Pseudomonadales bacterium]|nr:histidine--tRNA ligase [Pseudomonadales bacterium]